MQFGFDRDFKKNSQQSILELKISQAILGIDLQIQNRILSMHICVSQSSLVFGLEYLKKKYYGIIVLSQDLISRMRSLKATKSGPLSDAHYCAILLNTNQVAFSQILFVHACLKLFFFAIQDILLLNYYFLLCLFQLCTMSENKQMECFEIKVLFNQKFLQPLNLVNSKF
ncbi:hypothetical protein ABPG74_018035 [Tetrahymena malaccensis]